jgi:predicted HTH domain antitoxin
MNTTISFDYDVTAFGALRLSPSEFAREFARELRIAAAVQWYAQGWVSQGKAAELAALTRGDFLDELYRRKVPACQVTADELADEIHGP